MIGSTILALALQVAVGGNRSERAFSLQEYTVDAGHSIVEFSIGFALTHIKGRFVQWKGTILYDSANPGNSSITAVIDAKSIDTGWPNRDRHLRTSDFFDVERFPTISFQSTGLRQGGDAWIMDGSLTMHGVTRAVSLPFRFLPGSPVRSPESRNMILDAAGSMRLARTDFGITGGATYNSWFTKARAATMADSVDISFEIEGWRGDAASLRSPPIDAAVERIATLGIAAHLDRLRDQRSKVSPPDWGKYFRGQDLLVRALIDAKRTSDALALAKALPDLFANSADAYLELGFATSVAGDVKASAAAYARAKDVYAPPARDPNDPFPQDDDSWYYMDQLTRNALEAGRVSEAIGLARVLTELYPGNSRAHSRYGEALALAHQDALAATAFTKALQVDSGDTRALEYRRRLLR